jgi:hypothetical protein
MKLTLRHRVTFIAAPNAAVLWLKKPTSAGMDIDSRGTQNSDERNALYLKQNIKRIHARITDTHRQPVNVLHQTASQVQCANPFGGVTFCYCLQLPQLGTRSIRLVYS